MVAKNGRESNPTEEKNTFSEEQRRGFNSFQDVLAASGGTVPSITDVLGDGFSVLDDKTDLLGVPFIIVEYGTHESEINGENFSTLHVLTENGDKWIVNDGSTGIHAQCTHLMDKYGRVAPMHVPHGLRVSNYTYMDGDKPKKASTFYLSTAK